MLEVHAPHETIHTWKDFLIHIATIVLGLLIAVGLEQTVELFHHREQRHQLREDLRSETEQRIHSLQINQKINAADVAWYREILRLGREAKPSAGIVTLTLPSPPPYNGPDFSQAPTGVWTAKASGAVSVLTREEIEVWDQLDSYANVIDKSYDGRVEGLKVLYAFSYSTGIQPDPGVILHLTSADLDELMRAFARLEENTWILERDSASWQGACQAVLNGAKTNAEVEPYAARARRAMPQ
jgi:hypothetical protein